MSVRRGQAKAALPSSDYARPASTDSTGLVVTVFGESGGVEASFDFSGLTGSVELRRAFAGALDARSGPGGAWRSGETARNGYWALRAFLEYLSAAEHAPATAGEITPAAWRAWRLSLPNNHTSRNRVAILRTLLPFVAGLPTETLQASDRRVAQGPATTETAYSYPQLQEIKSKATATFNTALVRIRTNREHLRCFYAGEYPEGGTDWLVGEALDAILQTGDVPRSGKHRDIPWRYAQALGGRGAKRTWQRLYLTGTEAFALAVLLVASESWNRSVLHRMAIPDHDPAAGDNLDVHLVEIHKRRRPVRLRYTTNNLVDTGPETPGRLMSQAIEATEVARATLELLGRPTDRLLVSRRACAVDDLFCPGVPGAAMGARWAGEAKLATPDGAPFPTVSLRRIRRTVQVLIRKQPAQNTSSTHDSVYLLGEPATRAEARKTIATGLADALDHARVIVKMRTVLGDDANELLELSDDPELAKAVRDGDFDTATAACTDFFHSPFAEPGRPCTASFLWCLRCENAIATRRHLPRLVYLHRALNELRATLEPAVWDQDWREHFLLLHHLLAQHTTPAEQDGAVLVVADADRSMIDRLLQRGLDA